MKQRLNLIALIALPAAIGATYGLDKWLETLREIGGRTFDYLPLIWLTPVINLLYAVALLVLFWLMNKATGRWITVVYLAVGLVMLLYAPLWTFLLVNLPLTIRDFVPFDMMFVFPMRSLSLPGAFVTAAGLWGLIRTRRSSVSE